MNRRYPLENQHAVITGGGTGLGLAIAGAMLDAGARVTLIGRRVSVLDRARAALGGRTECITGDITDLAGIANLVATAEARAPIDILVNNAGRHHKAHVLATSDEDFASVVTANLGGTFALTRECARGMVERKAGSILVTTSMAAIFGIPGVPAYTASKAGLQGLVRQLAVDLAPHGVRVNAVAPGFIETDMNREIFAKDPSRLEKILARTPLGKLGTPDDVAEAAVYLASPYARFVTGVCLPVDGGAAIGF